MAELRRSGMFLLLATSLALCFAVFAQSPGKIEISKMNPAGLLVDKYSYMSQPYSFYYFHHMDELGLRTNWIRRGAEVYPLTVPAKDFSLQYGFHVRQYSLNDYFERNFVTGFLVLHGDRIIVERYFHGADRNSTFVSQSISKSVVSVLIGAAIGDGTIKSVVPQRASLVFRCSAFLQAVCFSTRRNPLAITPFILLSPRAWRVGGAPESRA